MQAMPTRRLMGLLLARLPDARLDVVADPRRRRRWRLAGFLDWSHLRTVVRIRREVRRDGQEPKVGERYFLSSLRSEALTGRGWAKIIRARWGVENNCHQLWDTIFKEDRHPWMPTSPIGALNIMLLRRLATNLLGLFRGRTLWSELGRLTPWKDPIRWIYNALIAATADIVAGLRSRVPFDSG